MQDSLLDVHILFLSYFFVSSYSDDDLKGRSYALFFLFCSADPGLSANRSTHSSRSFFLILLSLERHILFESDHTYRSFLFAPTIDFFAMDFGPKRER